MNEPARHDVAPAISVRGLRKRYTESDAVAGIDFEVRAGEVFAFLGPNGAGKTTTVELLEGFRERSGGEMLVLGEDPQGAGPVWRNRIGSVLQESSAEPGLTVRESLELYAGYYERSSSVEATIALVGLEAKADARGDQLSGGQRRRLDVALALIGDPELIFLDEPTTGFDPSARRAAWQVVRELRDLGKTVFLTTHYMDEAESLADRIAVISNGRIVAEGTPQTLGGRAELPARISFRLARGVEYPGARNERGRAVISSGEPLRELARISAWAESRALRIEDLDVRRPSLEDVYLQLTASR